mmetsp:Transcript_31672/g.78467  ORF Transcript_31672/g.78467 Transcript_31672/m.78467 type:complete len:280 (-) Transcript_31672:703-1542(-)
MSLCERVVTSVGQDCTEGRIFYANRCHKISDIPSMHITEPVGQTSTRFRHESCCQCLFNLAIKSRRHRREVFMSGFCSSMSLASGSRARKAAFLPVPPSLVKDSFHLAWNSSLAHRRDTASRARARISLGYVAQFATIWLGTSSSKPQSHSTLTTSASLSFSMCWATEWKYASTTVSCNLSGRCVPFWPSMSHALIFRPDPLLSSEPRLWPSSFSSDELPFVETNCTGFPLRDALLLVELSSRNRWGSGSAEASQSSGLLFAFLRTSSMCLAMRGTSVS